jgi:MoxR-like ATPase
MHQILLADEINRTSPRTQAALLEAMEEHCVTVDGETLKLPEPFMVAATQNPVESIGTYALPEAQMDRFMMKISLGYPSPAVSREMARRFLDGSLHEETRPVFTENEILDAKQAVLRISVHEDLIDYAASLVEFTRTGGDVLCGASPRAFLDLLQTARALAYLNGRDFCTPEDIRNNAKRVLAHRLIIAPEAVMRSVNGEKIIERALYEVPIPE